MIDPHPEIASTRMPSAQRTARLALLLAFVAVGAWALDAGSQKGSYRGEDAERLTRDMRAVFDLAVVEVETRRKAAGRIPERIALAQGAGAGIWRYEYLSRDRYTVTLTAGASSLVHESPRAQVEDKPDARR